MRAANDKRRVLLVDDEESLVWSLAKRLGAIRSRCEFLTANDGTTALAAVRASKVDLLVTDVRMPGMGGIDLVLAARSGQPDLPVVLMTAFKSVELERVTVGPFTSLLEKPFPFEELVRLVDAALAPPKVGFSGAISVQTLPDIVQLYALSSATGVLSVRHGGDVGEMWFERGNILHAVSPGAVGDEAVYETMGWDGGEFSMRPGITTGDRSVKGNWQELLMESCRRIDEQKRRQGSSSRSTGWTKAPPSTGDDPDLDISFEDLRLDTPDFGDVQELVTATNHALIEEASKSEVQIMNVKESLAKLLAIDGFIGAALVDSESGMLLGQEGGQGQVNLEVAAAGNTEVVRAKRKTMGNLGIKDSIEDILITLGKHYHLIRPLRGRPTLFFYVALDRSRANLAMARISLADVEKDLQV